MNKLFQINLTNFISVDSVLALSFEADFCIVITSQVKHRITAAQGRLLLSCFDVVKPIIEVGG